MPLESMSNDVLTDLSRLQFAKYLNVTALSVFIYDYCLTFPAEVEHVWGRRWETTRVVFTLSRYLPFIASTLTCYDALDVQKCGPFIFALDALYTASIIAAEGILILRTYALWGRSKKVICILLVLAAIFIAGATTLVTHLNYSLPGDSTSIYVFYPSACAYRTSRDSAFQYIFLMVYEIFLQGMSTWRKFRTYRNVHSKTLNTLYWDGIIYMWGIIVLSAANMAVMIAAPIAYTPSLDTAQVAVHSLLASRIFFNLRECDKEIHGGAVETEISLEPLSYQMQHLSAGRTTGLRTEEVVVIE